METKTIQVFEFKELEDEVKEKVLDKHREINLDYDWWDFIIEDFIQEAGELGFLIKEEDVTFELDRGPHFNVNTKGIDIKKDILKGYTIYAYIYIKSGYSTLGYGINSDFELVIEELHKGDAQIIKKEDRETDELEGVVSDMIWSGVEEKLNAKIQDLVNLCEEYYKRLKSEYEYMLSDEGIIDTIEANEFKFLKDGRVF